MWHSFSKDPDFHGRAFSVSTENDLGALDVLPMHANLISLIKNKISITPESGNKFTYNFGGGILEVSGNVVRVFLGV